MINTVISRQSSSDSRRSRIGNRRKVSVPARLTWRDASGTLRFVSVVMRDVSDVDAFVECQVPASIPLYHGLSLLEAKGYAHSFSGTTAAENVARARPPLASRQSVC